ncbi:hypothetical protein BpHYR1_018961 [Brachionus plicatilis]|uniref:Uncharacterized protein n=1 Tax=Brachionus plicatilis TaxID=10195 RepID=A0A3M7QNQ4_BRAPC|nr:hypothetical protein BpHYR1_018961 [Brachionus plicatilis]
MKSFTFQGKSSQTCVYMILICSLHNALNQDEIVEETFFMRTKKFESVLIKMEMPKNIEKECCYTVKIKINRLVHCNRRQREKSLVNIERSEVLRMEFLFIPICSCQEHELIIKSRCELSA